MFGSGDDWSRLERQYGKMADDELLELSLEQDDLTPVAREILFQEMSRRNLHGAAKPSMPVGDDADEFVRLIQQTNLQTVLFLQAALESLGIEARIEDQDVHTLEWFLQRQVDGISLFVRNKDVAAAREVMEHPYDSEVEVAPEE